MGCRRNELRNAACLILKLRMFVAVQDLNSSFVRKSSVYFSAPPPTFRQCPLTLFALATALPYLNYKESIWFNHTNAEHSYLDPVWQVT